MIIDIRFTNSPYKPIIFSDVVSIKYDPVTKRISIRERYKNSINYSESDIVSAKVIEY